MTRGINVGQGKKTTEADLLPEIYQLPSGLIKCPITTTTAINNNNSHDNNNNNTVRSSRVKHERGGKKMKAGLSRMKEV
jgi:hypothetical protein